MTKIKRLNHIKALRAHKAPNPITGRPTIIGQNQLERELTVGDPDTVRVTSVTYIQTWQG